MCTTVTPPGLPGRDSAVSDVNRHEVQRAELTRKVLTEVGDEMCSLRTHYHVTAVTLNFISRTQPLSLSHAATVCVPRSWRVCPPPLSLSLSVLIGLYFTQLHAYSLVVSFWGSSWR